MTSARRWTRQRAVPGRGQPRVVLVHRAATRVLESASGPGARMRDADGGPLGWGVARHTGGVCLVTGGCCQSARPRPRTDVP